MENPLDVANKLVDGDRQSAYGHPFDDFSKTAKIWSAILGIDVTPRQVALCMIGVKISREVNKHKDDNLDDMAGYIKTLWMVIQREKELQAELSEWMNKHNNLTIGGPKGPPVNSAEEAVELSKKFHMDHLVSDSVILADRIKKWQGEHPNLSNPILRKSAYKIPIQDEMRDKETPTSNEVFCKTGWTCRIVGNPNNYKLVNPDGKDRGYIWNKELAIEILKFLNNNHK